MKIVSRWEASKTLWEGEAQSVKIGLQTALDSEADLRGADLRGADLRGADLCGANLCGANLCGATLCDANLEMAKVSYRGHTVRVRFEIVKE